MSWRFRKSFRVLPGVRLNLSRSGLSATVGAAPFSINVGPRGVYGNLSIPGTGFSNRVRLDTPTDGRQVGQPSIPPPPLPNYLPSVVPLPTPFGTEIRSASTESLNSQCMNQLRDALRQAHEERIALENEIVLSARDLATRSQRFHSWDQGFLLKHLRTQSFEKRKEELATAQAKSDELHEQLRLTTVTAHLEIDREQAEPYYRMRDEFAALCGSQRIWDTLSRQTVHRFLTRSAADEEIRREPVRFGLSECDVFHWEQKVPHLPNRNGGDLYLYPGFVLYRASRQAFALIECREIRLEFRIQRCIEAEPVPSDSQVVGQAWAKSNKDGSPDQRFRNNYQIPVVLYGELVFRSASGLNEEFQVSNPALAQRFALAWNVFQNSIAPHR